MTRVVSLIVNGEEILLDHFVRAFVDHTVHGILKSLEGTEPAADVDLTVKEDKVTIQLNSKHVSTNAFVNKIIRSTLSGMVAPLKGVTGDAKTIEIRIK